MFGDHSEAKPNEVVEAAALATFCAGLVAKTARLHWMQRLRIVQDTDRQREAPAARRGDCIDDGRPSDYWRCSVTCVRSSSVGGGTFAAQGPLNSGSVGLPATSGSQMSYRHEASQ